MLHLEEITNLQRFLSLKEEWNRLLSISESNVIYLTHEWIFSWWQAFGQMNELSVVFVKKGSQIVGIAPFMISKSKFFNLPVRKLGFIGYGWMSCFDFLVADARQEFFELLIDWLRKNMNRYDVILFDGIPTTSQNLNILTGLLPSKGFSVDLRKKTRFYIPIDGSWEHFLKNRSYSFQRNLKNRKRRLEKIGKYKYERLTRIEQGKAEEILGRIFEVSLKSWKGREGTSIAQENSYRNFHLKLLNWFGPKGQVDVCFLRLNGEDIAYRYGFVHNNTAIEFDIAYDPEYSKISPGTLVLAHMNERYFDEGLESIDLGPDSPWKSIWNPSKRQEAQITLFATSVYSRLLHLIARHFRPVLNKIPR